MTKQIMVFVGKCQTTAESGNTKTIQKIEKEPKKTLVGYIGRAQDLRRPIEGNSYFRMRINPGTVLIWFLVFDRSLTTQKNMNKQLDSQIPNT